MELENIRYIHFDDPDRKRVQDTAIKAAKASAPQLIQSYREDPRSFEGRFVDADLFKEQFAEYAASRDARARYNNPVHNTAAALASLLFDENLKAPRVAERSTVYFLAGPPGAGKTTLVMATGALPRDAHMVYEGPMANYDLARSKVDAVLAVGLTPRVFALNVRPEVALDQSLRRYAEQGRGATIASIATAQARLPDTLARLAVQYGNAIQFDIIDLRDADHPSHLRGPQNIPVLKLEGNNEHIHERLDTRLAQLRRDGRATDDAWRQAAGERPRQRDGVDLPRDVHRKTDATGRDATQGSRQEAGLAQSRSNEPARTASTTHTRLRITDASKLPADVKAAGVRGTVQEVNDKHVLIRTSDTEAVRFTRAELPGTLKTGSTIKLGLRGHERSPQIEHKHDIGRT